MFGRRAYRFRPLLHKEQIEADMAEEMRTHLEMQEEANRAAGMSRGEAQYAALRQFGGIGQVKEAC
jgi:macrolide transport system ATP-binding/permease protein